MKTSLFLPPPSVCKVFRNHFVILFKWGTEIVYRYFVQHICLAYSSDYFNEIPFTNCNIQLSFGCQGRQVAGHAPVSTASPPLPTSPRGRTTLHTLPISWLLHFALSSCSVNVWTTPCNIRLSYARWLTTGHQEGEGKHVGGGSGGLAVCNWWTIRGVVTALRQPI